MTSHESGAIQNAGIIIERFGGIRPMARKLSEPVTTVQGWKKRGVIPSNRLNQITQAALEHNIDVADILKLSSSANQNSQSRPAPAQSGAAREKMADAAPLATANAVPSIIYQDIARQVSAAEGNALVKSSIINAILVLIATAAVVLLLWPETTKKSGQRIAALEQDVSKLESALAAAREQSAGAQSAVGQAMTQTRMMAQDVLGPHAGSIAQRAASLERHISSLSAFVSRLQDMGSSETGQGAMESAWNTLSSRLAGQRDPSAGEQEALDSIIADASLQSPDLQQAFAGVTPADMKAAALLLGLTQLRANLQRDNKPFAQDLDALKALIGERDPEMTAALDRLAPQAERGVLTTSGLSAEFAGMAGDVVKASLTGENVSIEEKARARLNNVFQIQKNGELLSGTATQAGVSRAQNALQSGDIASAIAELKRLEGPAAAAARPWIGKAEATMAAQKLQRLIAETLRVQSSPGGGVRIVDPSSSTSGGASRPVYIRRGPL